MLDEEIIYARVRSFCSDFKHTLSLQHKRLLEVRSSDLIVRQGSVWLKQVSELIPNEDSPDLYFSSFSDFRFFVIALCWLRNTCSMYVRGRERKLSILVEELRVFDYTFPHIRQLRNVGEHIDEYMMDSEKRHHTNVGRSQLQVHRVSGAVFYWLHDLDGEEIPLDVDAAFEHANGLFRALLEAGGEQR